jgi:hypothetical protein
VKKEIIDSGDNWNGIPFFVFILSGNGQQMHSVFKESVG